MVQKRTQQKSIFRVFLIDKKVDESQYVKPQKNKFALAISLTHRGNYDSFAYLKY